MVDGRLRGRGGGKLTTRFPRLGSRVAAAAGADELLVDGEVIVGPGDVRSFDLLHAGAGGARSPIDVVFVAFDLLRLDGRETIGVALEERRALLAAHLAENDAVVRSRVFADGPGLFAAAEAAGMEGVIAKRSSSLYTPGKRTPPHG